MIRSSRERNRSCSPVSCRSRGRIVTLPRSSRGQGITASDSKESQKQFARKPQRRRPIPAKTITWKGSITLLVQRLGNTSRATKKTEEAHSISSCLLRYAPEASWREDNRRLSNGEQLSRLSGLAMKQA